MKIDIYGADSTKRGPDKIYHLPIKKDYEKSKIKCEDIGYVAYNILFTSGEQLTFSYTL